MVTRTLVIEPDGTVRAVYSDRLPLRSLGQIAVQRASSVEFDERRQVWTATEIATGRILAEGTSRDNVIAQEVAALEGGL